MAYENLKAAIKQAIKQNGNQEITGNLLQNTLLNIVNTLGAEYKFLGFANSSTVPPTSEEGRLLYFATGHGDSYVNFPTSASGTYITLGYGIYALTREINSKYWRSDVVAPIAQEDVKTELDKKIDKASIAQATGNSETAVMSQKAVTLNLENIKIRNNSVCLRDSIFIDTVSNGEKVYFKGYNFVFAGTSNFQLAQPNLSVTITEKDFCIVYTTKSEKGLNYITWNNSAELPLDYIILLVLKTSTLSVLYSAAKSYFINGVSYEDYTSDSNLVPLCYRDSITINSTTHVLSVGDNFLFYNNIGKRFAAAGPITLSSNDFIYILADFGNNTLVEVPYTNIESYNAKRYSVLMLIHNYSTVLWSAGKYTIDGVECDINKVMQFVNNSLLPNTQLSIRETLYIDVDDENFNVSFKSTYFYVFSASFAAQYKSVDFSTIKTDLVKAGFVVIYLDLSEKPKFNGDWPLHVSTYDKYFNVKSNNSILIALVSANPNRTIYYSVCHTIVWNGKKYYNYQLEKTETPTPSSKISNLKYAQIGDSITYLYDNKYETSYDDRNTAGDKTGYKNKNGYGALFAKSLGIKYENHYPQGANGRTFCDYYDEWEQGHWSFPNGINIWTIFLGTNDWGTQRHGLGTKEDYLNNTYSASNRTTYGAIRKIVDKIRSQNSGNITPKIIFITPMQRGAFTYGDNPSKVFTKSAIKKSDNGQWEYVANSYGFTLKDVVDAIKWVCEYESFRCVDLFNNSIVDKEYLNTSQTWEELQPNYSSNWIYQDTLYDNLHPTATVGTKKIAGRLIAECGYDFYDIVS